MNIYVWKYLDKVSDNYHSGGGLLVVAETEVRARELANADVTIAVGSDQLADCVFPTSDEQIEQVIVFVDAGCC